MYACLCHYGFSSLVALILQNKKERIKTSAKKKIFFRAHSCRNGSEMRENEQPCLQ